MWCSRHCTLVMCFMGITYVGYEPQDSHECVSECHEWHLLHLPGSHIADLLHSQFQELYQTHDRKCCNVTKYQFCCCLWLVYSSLSDSLIWFLFVSQIQIIFSFFFILFIFSHNIKVTPFTTTYKNKTIIIIIMITICVRKYIIDDSNKIFLVQRQGLQES